MLRFAGVVTELTSSPGSRGSSSRSAVSSRRTSAQGFVIAGGYLFALLLALSPLGEAIISIVPMRLGEPSWRFGAVGLLTQTIITPFLGLALAGVIAHVAGHTSVLRGMSLLLGGGCAVFVALAGIFMWDYLNIHQLVAAEARQQFDIAATLAILRLGGFGVLAAVGSVASWRLSAVGRSRKGEPATILPRSSLLEP